MTERFEGLLDKIIDSHTKFAVLKLFRDNPYIMDNRLGLTLWVGRPEAVLSPELDEMVSLGVLKRWGTEPGAIYAYTRDEAMRRFLDEHWAEIAEQAGRNRWRQEQRQSSLSPENDDSEGKGD